MKRQAIAARRPDEEIAALLRQISDDELRKAVATAEADVQAVERAYEPVSEALGNVEKVIEEQIGLAGSFQHAVHDVEVAASDFPGGTGQSLANLHAAVAALIRSAQMLRRSRAEDDRSCF